MSILNTALVGKGIQHSLSPQLHQELFPLIKSRVGSSFTSIQYSLVECDEMCDFAAWVRRASGSGIAAANVTMPHKDTAFKLAMRGYGVAEALESANTLLLGEEILAASTDGQGFLSALTREYPTFNLEHYHLVCLGAGSSARAVLYALCTRWMPKSLTIVNRTKDRAQELAAFCLAQAPGPTVRAMDFQEFRGEYKEERHRLVLQATPVGSVNQPGNVLLGFEWNDTDLAADLLYNPYMTEFQELAATGGAKTIGGVGMLIEQAALSQCFWLSRSIPESSPLSDTEYIRIKTAVLELLK